MSVLSYLRSRWISAFCLGAAGYVVAKRVVHAYHHPDPEGLPTYVNFRYKKGDMHARLFYVDLLVVFFKYKGEKLAGVKEKYSWSVSSATETLTPSFAKDLRTEVELLEQACAKNDEVSSAVPEIPKKRERTFVSFFIKDKK